MLETRFLCVVDDLGVLAGVGLEDEIFDFEGGCLVDELFDEGEAVVGGVEGDRGLFGEGGLVEPIPSFVNIGEIGGD